MYNLRTLLWIYLWLLIFEGALRKWIVPALDAPLLIVRDPLVIWIYIVAAQRGFSFNNAFFYPNVFLAIGCALCATLFGEGNIAVTIYGLRTDFLQIPLIFLIPQILDRDDVIAMGKFMLYASMPIAVLALIQFKSSPDSLINKGAFHTHYATVRPSGPFSFIPGMVAFYALVSSFLFYGYLKPGTYRVWMIAAVTFDMLLTGAVSGSRSFLVWIGIVALVAIFCVVVRGKGIAGLLIAVVVIVALLPIMSMIPAFQEGTKQLTQRFIDGASAGEDTQGFVDRYADTMLGPLEEMSDAPLFGRGLGIGTNAAQSMLHGERLFLDTENEWGRLIVECGPILGGLLCLFRLALTLAIGKRAYDAYRRDNVLPLLIYASSAVSLLNGQWGVPTSLGFAIFSGGLTLAACVEPEEYDEEEEEDETAGEESDHQAEPGHVA